MGSKGCVHVVPQLLATISGVCHGKMAVCGHWGAVGRLALLALAATMGS